MKILHILNGDSTAQSFGDTGLEGDQLVWREILSEGPLQTDISSAAFWRARANWIGKTFRETPEDYLAAMMSELSKLGEPYDEINLWFEFDLHCQANLLGVLNYLIKKADLSAPAVYLVCPEDYPGKENFMGMGELTGEELEYLYDNIRVQLGEPDFALAAEAWLVYVSQSAEKLRHFIEKTGFWANLSALKPALEAQLKRLQVDENGLNGVEKTVLDIYQRGATTKHDIYRRFWSTEKIYGFGDSQIDIYLNQLKQKGLIRLTDD